MPRKWTPEEKRAWGEKMKALREAKKEGLTPVAPPPSVEEPLEPSAPEEVQGETELEQLKRHVEELSKTISQLQAVPPVAQGPQVTSQGIRGTVIKFSLDPKVYPSPIDRLFTEKDLIIQGFTRDWFDVEWAVGQVNYQTIDGINTTEPKFQVRLIKIIPDEEGMPSKKRFQLHKMTFFEDPQAAIQVANQYGLEVAEDLTKAFLDEMRYLRVRDWVRESFYPPKPTQSRMNKKEEVIGNRLVEVFEVNSVEPTAMPFKPKV